MKDIHKIIHIDDVEDKELIKFFNIYTSKIDYTFNCWYKTWHDGRNKLIRSDTTTRLLNKYVRDNTPELYQKLL